MNYPDQTISTRKLVFELEVTGDNEDFELCQRLCDSFINLVRQVVQVTKVSKRLMWTAYLKPPLSQKSHAKVQLPNLNGNRVTKQPVNYK